MKARLTEAAEYPGPLPAHPSVRLALENGLWLLEQNESLAARVSSLEARLESAHRGLGEWRAKHEALEAERDSWERAWRVEEAMSTRYKVERNEAREGYSALATTNASHLGALEALREKAQEVRRAWEALHDHDELPSECPLDNGAECVRHRCQRFARWRAAIDALVPPVPAPHENEKEARS